MTWQDKIAFDRCKSPTSGEKSGPGAMQPGLTGEYDLDTRGKAATRNPPPPPEYMGVEGEYDSYGLVKRVAAALDANTEFAQLDNLTLIQDGAKIIFEGTVPQRDILSHLVDCASRVDGTRTVEIGQVTVE